MQVIKKQKLTEVVKVKNFVPDKAPLLSSVADNASAGLKKKRKEERKMTEKDVKKEENSRLNKKEQNTHKWKVMCSLAEL